MKKIAGKRIESSTSLSFARMLKAGLSVDLKDSSREEDALMKKVYCLA